MRQPEATNSTAANRKFIVGNYALLTAVSLTALAATFLVSNLNLSFAAKFTWLVFIVFAYAAFSVFGYARERRAARDFQPAEIFGTLGAVEVESKLLALEEAGQFFGVSLKPEDMFRLAASRMRELIPFAACALLVADEEKLKVAFAVGADALSGVENDVSAGAAGKVFRDDKAEIFDESFLRCDRLGIQSERKFRSAIAAPLHRNESAFGVLILYSEAANAFDENSRQLLEAVAARVAPLFLSAKTVENNLASALVDALTQLPNERAFYLILENQIAESQRFRDARPLTILTIDIKDFDELNARYGHLTGDGILQSAADLIKNQLRQMDFLARARADEFYVVLPTASEEITREIVERVERAFRSKPFAAAPQEMIHLQLNFGAASFVKDGETAAVLLKHALLRKQQAKTADDGKILWFPKEYVN